MNDYTGLFTRIIAELGFDNILVAKWNSLTDGIDVWIRGTKKFRHYPDTKLDDGHYDEEFLRKELALLGRKAADIISSTKRRP